MSEYEMMLVIDPRLSDEEVVAINDETKALLGSYEAEVLKEESWGKRKLAYPIKKLSEGRYMLFEIRAGERNPFLEVEQRLRQNEKVLRYMTVRTDKGRLRRRESAEPEGTPEPSEEQS